MKILIFSDSHLSKRFDKRKYAFLHRIISQADRVIINGDFWEGYDCTFSQFIHSSWKKLFPLLKEKETVYVYGNHDKKNYADKRVSLFSIAQTKRYTLRSGSNIYYIEHGDRLTPFNDSLFQRMPRILNTVLTFMEKASVKLTGMKAVELVYQRFNNRIKKEFASKLKENEYLVCGHTSFPQLDLAHHYLNSGWIKHGVGEYITIEDGKPQLHDERY